MKEICENCGKEYVMGEWPYCPHGFPHGMHTFKPYVDEHMLDHPVEITSWAQRNRIARQAGLVERDRPKDSYFAERRDKVEWYREVQQREAKHSA